MKRTLDQMYNSYDSHRPLKRHKTNNDLYEIMVDDISLAKQWDKNKTIDIIDNGPYFNAINAVEKGIITDVMFPDEFNDYIKDLEEEGALFLFLLILDHRS